MATHLVSLLSDVEQALAEGSALRWGVSWNLSRSLNERHQVGRITLTPPPGATPSQARGAIFLHRELSPGGTLHLKASFHWHGSEAFPSIAITTTHATALGWKSEAARIAAFWMAGPPVGRASTSVEFAPSVALAS
jgi:hypothetical protein